jgi:CMP/dCMP kinase
MSPRPYILAIDGPAGAGKSTIAKGVAKALGISRVDTGAIYRALTVAALEQRLEDDDAIVALLPTLDLRFEGERVLLGGREITTEIRTPTVSANVSRVSAIPAVRAGLLELQRRLGRADRVGALLEGRDIGTVVFPDAEVKIFLTASPEERARRRLLDLSAAGEPTNFEEVLAAIIKRDHYDSNRAVAPLRPAEDAITIDSTGKPLAQVIEEICAVVRSRGLC